MNIRRVWSLRFPTVVLLLLASLSPIYCQVARNSVPQNNKTSGQCSPIVSGDHNVIDCGLMTAEDAAKLSEILNDVRSSNKSLVEIKELILKATDPNRTVTTYRADGAEYDTNSSGGVNVLIKPGQYEVFKQFLQLSDQKRWTDLISLAEKEKADFPTWYTSDFYLSMGYYNTCKIDLAIETIDVFIRETENIMSYEGQRGEVIKGHSVFDNHKRDMQHNCATFGKPSVINSVQPQ